MGFFFPYDWSKLLHFLRTLPPPISVFRSYLLCSVVLCVVWLLVEKFLLETLSISHGKCKPIPARKRDEEKIKRIYLLTNCLIYSSLFARYQSKFSVHSCFDLFFLHSHSAAFSVPLTSLSFSNKLFFCLNMNILMHCWN